jgi:hypothetical protein
MKVALCCIGRLENRYAVEYVEYYKLLGFDKIFIYDNNHDGEEHFEDVLQPYIDDDFVTVINFRNKEAAQLSAYNDCYSKYGNEYDWIAFFDFDEFLTLVNDKNIKDYLSHFNDFQGVKINWMIYTDNNLVTDDGRGVLERFTEPMDYDKIVTYEFPENNHVKSIIKGGITNLTWNATPHAVLNIIYCNSVGNNADNSPFEPYTFETAYIKHFSTKTIDEFINGKYKKGLADRTNENYKKNIDRIGYFFKINKSTKEKKEYINDVLNNNIDIFIGTQKTFTPQVSNEIYKIIVGNHEITNNSNLQLIQCKHDSILDDRFYSELYMLDYVSKNVELKDYVGFCHNRRYFSFLDEIPNMEEIFDKYDAIVAEPITYKITIKEQYEMFHNIEDLYVIGGIIADKYPSYSNVWHNFINGNILIPYNMFIMKREDFKEYINFIFSILDEYLNIIGTDINKRIYDNFEKYIKDFYPNNTVEYQYRIGGYISERLTNLFMMHKFKIMKTYPVIVTENKYITKEDSTK